MKLQCLYEGSNFEVLAVSITGAQIYDDNDCIVADLSMCASESVGQVAAKAPGCTLEHFRKGASTKHTTLPQFHGWQGTGSRKPRGCAGTPI